MKTVSIPEGEAWEGFVPGQICVDVPGIGFRSYDDVDEAVNSLFFGGHKVLARAVNRTFKEQVNV